MFGFLDNISVSWDFYLGRMIKLYRDGVGFSVEWDGLIPPADF